MRPRPGLMWHPRPMRILGLLAVVCVVACSKDQPGPAQPGPGERVCTAMGCVDGLRLEFVVTGKWFPGRYKFAFDLDGEKVTCTGELPLKPCDQGPSLTCDPAGKVQIGESGCALPPETHGFADVQIAGAPRAVTLNIDNDDKRLIDAELTPKYATSRPNGEGCEPVCNSALERIPMPSL